MEEFESADEELITLNSELQHKVEDLAQVNNDVNNVIASIESGTIFLSPNLGITYFTPYMTKLFNLISSDVGRSLRDITSKVAHNSLYEDAESVLQTLQARESEVQTQDGKWFSMCIIPYRTQENVMDGWVITFTDITRLKIREQELREARSYAEAMIDLLPGPMLILDSTLQVLSVNQAFCQSFKTSPEEALSRKLCTLGNGQWDIPELRRPLDQAVLGDAPMDSVVGDRDFFSTGTRKMRIHVRRLPQAGASPL